MGKRKALRIIIGLIWIAAAVFNITTQSYTTAALYGFIGIVFFISSFAKKKNS